MAKFKETNDLEPKTNITLEIYWLHWQISAYFITRKK